MTNRSADEARHIADTDPQNVLEPATEAGYLYSDPISTYYIFSTYDSISRGITSMIQKRLDKLREM